MKILNSNFLCSVGIILFSLMIITPSSHGEGLTASWYSTKECVKINPSLLMANGRKLNDEAFTAASWDYPFGTILEITNVKNGKKVLVTVTDRGPNRRFYRQGRVCDLSMAAFRALENLRKGIIFISIKKVRKI